MQYLWIKNYGGIMKEISTSEYIDSIALDKERAVSIGIDAILCNYFLKHMDGMIYVYMTRALRGEYETI